MANNDLKTWVSDKLMVLLGYSQSAVVNYLIAEAKKSKSPTQLVGVLLEYGFASSGDTRLFAQEIFARVPRKAAGVNLYQQREAEAAMLVRRQQTYALIDADDDEDEGEVVKEKKPSASESRKSDKGKKRFRKKSGHSDDSDEEVPVREDSRHVRRKVSEDEDDGSELVCLADLEFDYINPYDSASRINSVVLPEFIVQGVLCVFYLITGHWFMALLCLPYLYYNFQLYSKRQHLVDVTEIFNLLNREKKKRLFKLAYIILNLFLTIFWMIYSALDDHDD